MRQICTMQQKNCFMDFVSAEAASCSRSAANLETQLDICCMNMCVSILGFQLISYGNNLLHHCCSSSATPMMQQCTKSPKKKCLNFGPKNLNIKFMIINLIKHKNCFNLRKRRFIQSNSFWFMDINIFKNCQNFRFSPIYMKFKFLSYRLHHRLILKIIL